MVVAGYALRECVRRRVFPVVLVLTAAFLALYALASALRLRPGRDDRNRPGARRRARSHRRNPARPGDVHDALPRNGPGRVPDHDGRARRRRARPPPAALVRPVGRSSLLAGRFAAAGGVCVAYVLAVYACSVLITNAAGGWWPDRVASPGLALAGGVVLIAALSLLGSVASGPPRTASRSSAFGAGLAAGLLGQIGSALSVETLEDVAMVTWWLLPLRGPLPGRGSTGLTADRLGATGVLIRLGPFGAGGPGERPAGMAVGRRVPWCSVGYSQRARRSTVATSEARRRPRLFSAGWPRPPPTRCSRA